MSSERLCVCGKKLSSMNRSLKCYACKEKAELEKRRQTAEKILADAKKRGLVRLHSCISDIHDPTPRSCSCKKFVTFAETKEFIKIGRCVDFLTRSSSFFERAVVEKSRHKNVPLSTIGQQIAIERRIAHRGFDERDIVRMQAIADENLRWRQAEQKFKCDFESITVAQELSKLTVYVDEKSFDEMKEQSWGRPDRFVISEDRTSVGRDVGANRNSTNEADETEERDEETNATETNADEVAEPEAPEVTESVEALAEI
jgi:hypothetical protein